MMPVLISIRGPNVDLKLTGQVLTINDKFGSVKTSLFATVRLLCFRPSAAQRLKSKKR